MERESYKQKPKLTIADLLISGFGRLSYWYYFDLETNDGFCNSGQWSPPCRMTRWMAVSEFKALGFCLIHQLPKKNQIFQWTLIAEKWSFCAKQSEVAESNCHSARSKLESQNLIVIPREAKWNRRIYWRTDDGFCNSGQKSPQCRMTRWMALSEFKALRFCQVHQLPKKSRFSFERSLLTPYSERSKVAKTNCHSARSKVESQNLSFIKTSAQFP